MKLWKTSKRTIQGPASAPGSGPVTNQRRRSPIAGRGTRLSDSGNVEHLVTASIPQPFATPFPHLSLTKRFAIVSFGILLTGMLILGWWVTKKIEEGVLHRTGVVTASFVSSTIAPQLADPSRQGSITEDSMRSLDALLTETELGQRIVSFKIWSPSGTILFSPDRDLVGREYEIGPDLSAALRGQTVSKISGLDEPENEFERLRFTELQETYTPLREQGSGDIIGVVEFYERTGPLRDELRNARGQTWLIVGGATVLLYIILVGMVGRASQTITLQRRELTRAEAQNELDRIKDQFVSGVSHELRTPLGFIRGYASTLLRKDVTIDSETGQEFLQIISDESENLGRMIEDLLDTSRIQEGSLAVRPTQTGLRDLVNSALERARLLLEKSGHNVTIRHISGDAIVLADPGRIEQVLFNLVDNSIRYSSSGSPILVRTELREEFALISVIDHGEGIPADQLEEIFEPFQRGDTAATSRTRGTGLGLAVSRAIIDAHGGRIWAESTPGRGATVSFTLPISDLGDDNLPGLPSDGIGG